MAHGEGVDIQALLLHQTAGYGQPRQQEQGRLVCHIGAYIILGGIVPAAVEKLEGASPVVVPATRNILLTKVGIVEKVAVLALMGVEARSGSHLKAAEGGQLVLVLAVYLHSLVGKI